MNQRIDVEVEALPITAVEVLVDDTVTLVEILPPPLVTVEVATAGAMGPQGIQGEQGEQGIQGIQGQKGDTGAGVIGGSITIGPTPPANPGVNDVWVDTS